MPATAVVTKEHVRHAVETWPKTDRMKLFGRRCIRCNARSLQDQCAHEDQLGLEIRCVVKSANRLVNKLSGQLTMVWYGLTAFLLVTVIELHCPRYWAVVRVQMIANNQVYTRSRTYV